MTAFKALQVSDTHLSRTHGYFQDNWDAFVECATEEKPDFVFVTGDMCFNGPANPDDIAYAREQMDRLPCPWRAIPGNHDIGDVPPDRKLDHPISPDRRAVYRQYFGEEYWIEDLGGWRFVGLNAQLMGSGLPDEPDQMVFLEDALAGANNRPVALLVHKPLFRLAAEEAEESRSTVHPDGRRATIALCEKFRVRLVACGHRHCYRSHSHKSTRLIWAPATAFIDTRKKNEGPRMKRRAGYIRYRFDGRRFAHDLVEPALFINHDMRNWMAQAGSTTKLPARPLPGAAQPA